MTMSTLHPTLRRGSLAIAIGLCITTSAVAQEQTDKSPTNLDKIEVTGSRIRSVDVENSQPVLVLTRQDIEKQGLTSVADVLKRIPSNGATMNSTVNNGGDGSATVSLRNLGASRTLVLVNGRRWVSGLSGSVDLNTIPSAIVERVEVLKDGASSIYGSDAIAGVVNIITRSDFDGAEVNAYVGQYGQGDGQRTSFDATVGATSERGNLVIGLSSVKEDAVMAGDREISAEPVYGAGSSAYSSYSASGRLRAGGNSGTWTVLPGSATASGDSNYPRYGLDQYTAFNTSDYGYNYAKDNYLVTPQKRDALYVQGNYALTDNVRFKFDGLYNRRQSSQQLAGFPLASVNTGILMSGDSYYNPYNSAYGGDGRDVGWSHRLTEFARTYQQDVKTSHVYTGLEGDFQFADRQFSWDVGFAHNQTDQTETQYGDVNLLNLGNALGASAIVNGTLSCLDSGGAVIAGCVPFNPLSPAGGVTQEMLDYILFTAHNTYQYKNSSFTANLTGDLFELPAGWMSFAAGVEHREESGFSSPDALISAGYTSGNSFTPTSGSYTLNDYYTEVAIPLLKDVPGAQLLELSAAVRYSDYNTFGSTTNSKFGFKWKPVADLLIRGNYATGFRAPSIENLYLGASDSFDTYSDPCSTNSTSYTGAIAAACTAGGVPANYVAEYNSASGNSGQTIYPFTYTSNANLQPEKSKNATLGFVYSPASVQGLDVSLDWWKIKITDAITEFSANQILSQCYQFNVSAFCDLVTRDATGAITGLVIQPVNVGEQRMQGYDFTARYKLPQTAIGQFMLTLDSTYVAVNEQKQDDNAAWESYNGIYHTDNPNWRTRGTLTLDWSYGNLAANWAVRYYSGMKDYDSELDDAGNYRHVAATAFNDMQVSYQLPWNATVRVGLNNVFDRDPPVALSASANSFDSAYAIPGRYSYLQYTQRF
ncbi:Vitamin B12 transporter BtuB [Xanthomonas arboricola]|uniref:Vitamin B12 transporter BtuB n=1 Tax=Xanthomonas arboricola TaxID=56448 RepID=A0AAU9IAQ4_9XANT|nr:Vitamin B12 transporter BtuB [Xanthomonas arboricola]CAE6813949.1 Vitamin B12 transporter BtuB [Xanthomonas arboricola]